MDDGRAIIRDNRINHFYTPTEKGNLNTLKGMADPKTPNMDDKNGNGWPAWRKVVLIQLDEARKDIRIMDNKIDGLEKSMERMRTRINIYSSMGGAGAGAIIALIMQFVFTLV